MESADGASPVFSWNLVADLHEMWSYPFMVNAFRAGSIVALVSAVVGWFVVLRRQTFAGHTLSVVAFPGAALAALLGLPLAVGYFGACVAGALVLAARPRVRGGAGVQEAALTGTVQSFALACGFLFVTLSSGRLAGPQSLLFGTFLGVTSGQVLTLAIVGVVVLVVLAVIARPLLFASVDPDVAARRAVPVRRLDVVFLALVGAATAQAGQITGALLVFALMVIPAATAQALTARPVAGVLCAVAIALVCCWGGLVAAYYQPYPVGFFVTSIAFGGFLLVRCATVLAGAVGATRRGRRVEVAV